MQVFVCYPSEQEQGARAVRNFIRSVSLDCWFDKDNLVGGDDWDRERRLALAEADIVAILCSDATTGRNGVYQREINEALEHARDRRVGTRYIIPIRLSDDSLPPELKRFQYIDWNETSGKRALAMALKRAVEEKGDTVPSALQVAASAPDEGGVIPLSFSEERAKGTIDANWITYDMDGEYWQYVNGVIRARVLGELYQARRHIDEWTNRAGLEGGSYWDIDLQEYYRKGQLVSLMVGWSDYFSGAAHPNHGLKTINIFGDQAGIVPIHELFEYDLDPLAFLTDYVNSDIKRQANSEENAWDIGEFVKDYGWDVFEQFSFNDRGMQLNFSSASGLPHVMGYFEVYVPWQHAERHLSPVAKSILLGKGAD